VISMDFTDINHVVFKCSVIGNLISLPLDNYLWTLEKQFGDFLIPLLWLMILIKI